MNSFELLKRVTYGPTPELIDELERLGWSEWVRQQLFSHGSEEQLKEKIRKAKFNFKNSKGSRNDLKLKRYFMNNQQNWNEVKDQKRDGFLYNLPGHETVAFSWMHQMYSKYQLRELMVEFWHNHFNVAKDAGIRIALFMPAHDKIVRNHCLGNFHDLLVGTAKSPSMLVYLDNERSQASPANENYARELFELHTLGAENYLNHLYDDWTAVPGATEGVAEGFIDEDVYETARAFTGWTVGDGRIRVGVKFPDSGDFHYCDQWHDHYQKRVLGVEFKSHRPAMSEANEILEMLAHHPGTARHLCRKICSWLVADDPPAVLIDKAVDVWMASKTDEDQIAKVLEAILNSTEFLEARAPKVKRPNILATSLYRAVGASYTGSILPSQIVKEMGYKMFEWEPPTGHPDNNTYWSSSNMLLQRWNAIPKLLNASDESDDCPELNLAGIMGSDSSGMDEIINFWYNRLNGRNCPEAFREELKSAVMGQAAERNIPLLREEYPEAFEDKLRKLVSLIAIGPEFQYR